MNLSTFLIGIALVAAKPQNSAPAAANQKAAQVQAQADLATKPSAPLSQESNLPVLTLDAAVKEAVARNPDIKVAQARLAQAHELSSKAWAGYLPQITVSGNFQHSSSGATLPFPTRYLVRDVSEESNPDPSRNQPAPGQNSKLPGKPSSTTVVIPETIDITLQAVNQSSAQVQLSQAILVPTLWPAIRNSYIAEKVAELNTDNARREILFAVAQLYYGAAAMKETVAVQQRLLENNLAHEKDAKVRVDAGAAPRISLIRAKIDRSKAEEDLLRAQNAYASSKISLATLLDRDADFEVVRPDEPKLPDQLSSLEEASQRDRPDVQAARTSNELAIKVKSGTYYKYLPSLVGSAFYRVTNTKGTTGTYDSWVLALALNWTIWDGGLRESELRENSARVVESDANLRNAEIKARDEVRRAELDLKSAKANLAKAEEQVKLARENMRLVEVSFQAGAATPVEVSDANTALTSAENGFVAETLNAQLSALKLLKAAGAFNP